VGRGSLLLPTEKKGSQKGKRKRAKASGRQNAWQECKRGAGQGEETTPQGKEGEGIEPSLAGKKRGIPPGKGVSRRGSLWSRDPSL